MSTPMLIFNINLIEIAFVLLAMWTIYVVVEVLRRYNILRGEVARKSIHIGVGILFACLPIFMNRREIFATAALFFIAMVLLSGMFKLFKAYEDVSRWTIGQFLYPLGIMIVVFLFSDLHIYSFAVLVLALSDAAAAIIGTKFGDFHYHFFGGDKTIAGSLAFFTVTLTLLTIYVFSYGQVNTVTLIMIPVSAWFLTGVEAMFAGGFDNLAIPVFAALILSAFTV
jgi:phytol kinase